MYPFLFVVIPVTLLFLMLALYFGSEALASVKGLQHHATGSDDNSDELWMLRSNIERAYWSVMFRMATRAGVTIVVLAFCALVAWLAWITVFHLSAPWMVAYIALAGFGLWLMTLESDHKLPAVDVAMLVVIVSVVWVLLHLGGWTHISTPPIHILHVTIPRITITIP